MLEGGTSRWWNYTFRPCVKFSIGLLCGSTVEGNTCSSVLEVVYSYCSHAIDNVCMDKTTFRKSRMGVSAWDVRSYNYTFRPCVRHRTASLCGSILYGNLDGCFSTACSTVEHLDSRTIHFLCVSDLGWHPCVVLSHTDYLMRKTGFSSQTMQACQ